MMKSELQHLCDFGILCDIALTLPYHGNTNEENNGYVVFK